ncbi:MAG TPA: 30S ribosomal protein S5 [archaeon]|nr:30S ribosomal protein S5 [archaeon]
MAEEQVVPTDLTVPAENKPVETPKQLEEIPTERRPDAIGNWIPKTLLGKAVMEGRIKDLTEILKSGKRIREAEIVDSLMPGLKNEIILIGGRTGKGGGIERIPIRTTATMTKSGRRFTMNAFVVVGNEDGIVGIGKGSSPESRNAVNKAVRNGKLNLLIVNRGCGSWECRCGTGHSIPYKTSGGAGSVKVELKPAPKGVGLVCNDEMKKIFRLAGIKDIWIKNFGNTGMRINSISAIYNALKNLNIYNK